MKTSYGLSSCSVARKKTFKLISPVLFAFMSNLLIYLETSISSQINKGIPLDLFSPSPSSWLSVKASSQKTDRGLRVGGLHHLHLFK